MVVILSWFPFVNGRSKSSNKIYYAIKKLCINYGFDESMTSSFKKGNVQYLTSNSNEVRECIPFID